MKTRQEKWKEKGYTQEQIECHLNWERRKSKESREKRKRNNENNKEIVNEIKKDLLGITFNIGDIIVVINSIRPSVDGKGFWFGYTKQFKDGSEGQFREFQYFKDYNYIEFIKYLRY